MNEDVTCLQLWKNWLSKTSNDPYVIDAYERTQQYSRQDWVAMGEEARQMMEHMTDKVTASQELSEEDFDRLCAHLEHWFFKVTRSSIEHLALCSRFDKDYILFFNKYAEGLNIYVYNLVKKYSHKLPL
jgi:3-oxoacyl-[acyl-carrier-protein] synthase III